MVIQIKLVDLHALSGSVIHHLETMRERIAEEARKAHEKAAGSSVKDPKGKKQSAPKNTQKNASHCGFHMLASMSSRKGFTQYRQSCRPKLRPHHFAI